MNTKYQRYIDYIVSDLEIPYFKNMKEMYGLRPDEYEMVLSKLYNQPVTIKGDYVFNNIDYDIYHEDSTSYWYKKEYDNQGNEIYFENSNGFWVRYKYDEQGNKIYHEDSDGNIIDDR